MEHTEDRRKAGEKRVAVQTLVEICGNEPGSKAFEAEAVDVSRRGMQVRTAYLPEIGEPLVCRFEEDGKEIIAEGAVAWRTEQARGGEFGIVFTALESRSVEALRRLCGDAAEISAQASQPASAEDAGTPGAGGRVRLHIDGLGSPMKARVRDANRRQVEVGSNLGFLRVGQHLELESIDKSRRHGATIDSVKVAVDPQTQVPELVVVLRFDDALDATPEPSVVDSEAQDDEERSAEPAMPATAATEGDAAHTDAAGADALLRNRLGVAAIAAGGAMKDAGAAFARTSAEAAVGLGRALRLAAERVRELRKRGAGAPPARRTSPPPSGILAGAGTRLRPQSQKASEATVSAGSAARPSRRRTIAAAAAIGVLVITIGALAFRGPAAPASAEADAALEEHAETKLATAASLPAPKAPLVTNPAASKTISADVPLFGPTPMATMEPAPLGAPPEDMTGVAAEEAAELRAAQATPVDDEKFPDDAPRQAKKKQAPDPRDVAPWGQGRMRQPTIHRLRLDGPGGAIQGAMQPTGFTVVIPGRKVMEAGKYIQKRDDRIARVRTNNGASGAQVSFQFRDGVPAYRVRLRKDFVEFLISAPDPKAKASRKKQRSEKSSRSR